MTAYHELLCIRHELRCYVDRQDVDLRTPSGPVQVEGFLQTFVFGICACRLYWCIICAGKIGWVSKLWALYAQAESAAEQHFGRVSSSLRGSGAIVNTNLSGTSKVVTT